MRQESRASLIAYGFLRGRAYRQIEASCINKPNWDRAAKIAEKFSVEDVRVTRQRFAQWSEGAAM